MDYTTRISLPAVTKDQILSRQFHPALSPFGLLRN